MPTECKQGTQALAKGSQRSSPCYVLCSPGLKLWITHCHADPGHDELMMDQSSLDSAPREAADQSWLAFMWMYWHEWSNLHVAWHWCGHQKIYWIFLNREWASSIEKVILCCESVSVTDWWKWPMIYEDFWAMTHAISISWISRVNAQDLEHSIEHACFDCN
jgi:hypothetical protein